MRFIEDESIRDKYKGERIFVVGEGPSLDDFPDNFFDKKIMVTVNGSYLAVPITEDIYISSVSTDTFDSLRKEEPELLVHGLVFCPVDRLHSSGGRPYNQIGCFGEIPIYAKCSIGKQTKEDFEEAARKIVNHQPVIIRSRGTSAHQAVQAAAILGAKKITLVGCDEHCLKFRFRWLRSRRGKPNPFPGTMGLTQLRQEGKDPGMLKWKEGRIWMTRAFRSCGIEIQRYFYKDGGRYKKGYEVIN